MKVKCNYCFLCRGLADSMALRDRSAHRKKRSIIVENGLYKQRRRLLPSLLFIEDSNLGFAGRVALRERSAPRKTQNAERLEAHHREERVIQKNRQPTAVCSFVWRALEDSNLGFADSIALRDRSAHRKTQNASRLEAHHRGERTIQTEKTAVAVFIVHRGFEPWFCG